MGGVLLLLALVSGLLTCFFIATGLRRAFGAHKTLGARTLVLTTLFSLLTGVFTIWQLILVAWQLRFP
jgi:hypothetical protein